jgi:hypothetical protein
LQHAQIIRFIHGLLQQLLIHSWQLGICNVGTDGLGVRQDDRVCANHEIWTILGVRTLKSQKKRRFEKKRTEELDVNRTTSRSYTSTALCVAVATGYS